MAPITSNQLLALNLPVVVILLSYLWYKRKRIGAPSDPGDKESADNTDASVEINKKSIPLDIEPKSGNSIPSNLEESFPHSVENTSPERSSVEGSQNRNFSRSLSAPIPINLPKELRYTRALNISDEELDQHIEKLKSSVVKTDPFELINQGKITNSLSPSQKFRSHNSISCTKYQETSTETTLVSPCEEENLSDHQKTVQSSEDIEKIDTISNQDIVQITVVEEIVSNQDTQEDTLQESSSNIVSTDQTNSPCAKMTSNSCEEIPEDSKSPCIEKVEEVKKELVQSHATVSEQEVTSSLEDLTTNDDLDETLTENRVNSAEERPSSAEERPSSAEGRTSSAEERPNSVEPVPSASTGAIPKQKKKKKFKKLNCDLKDLGEKLKETQIRSTGEVNEEKRTEQKSRNDSGCEREDTNPHNSGRQSANESPSDAMMIVSTSLSSLNESEGSNDSGKGCSDVITPPPLTDKPIAENTTKYYEFLLHKSLVGKLIGKRGCFVNLIYTKTNAHVIVKDHPQDNENKICIVEGTKEAINKAMKMIKQRFPKEKLEQFFSHSLPPTQRQEPFVSTLILPAATNLETQISCMVMPNHLFLQQPFHPTYLNFVQMHHYINSLYETEEVPLVPKPIKENIICVAYTFQSWNRAVILSVDEKAETAYVRAMDFGGFAYVHFSKLKQIRPDLLLLPFQASECFLANIEPLTEEWPSEAYALIADLTSGVMLYTHVVDLTEDNIPLVNCQVIRDDQLIWINQELVNHGYARWINELPQTEVEEQTPEESE